MKLNRTPMFTSLPKTSGSNRQVYYTIKLFACQCFAGGGFFAKALDKNVLMWYNITVNDPEKFTSILLKKLPLTNRQIQWEAFFLLMLTGYFFLPSSHLQTYAAITLAPTEEISSKNERIKPGKNILLPPFFMYYTGVSRQVYYTIKLFACQCFAGGGFFAKALDKSKWICYNKNVETSVSQTTHQRFSPASAFAGAIFMILWVLALGSLPSYFLPSSHLLM